MQLTRDELEQRILHEGDGLIVVDKCPDLPTSGRTLRDEDCLQHALIERHGGMVWAVHQLDADTSGVNLFTTRRECVEPLKQALASGTKHYVALVHGVPKWDRTGCIEPIGPIDDRSLGVSAAGRPARSHFQVLRRAAQHTWVEVELDTGRTHQIRIHLSHLGHPLVGEEWYRDSPCKLHCRQALHAWRMTLDAPFAVSFEAPLPGDLTEVSDRLGPWEE